MDEMVWTNQRSSAHTEALKPRWTSKTEFPEDYYVRMTIEFGPAFSADAEMSRQDLIDKLRAEAPRWERSFIATMMQHLADHLQNYATQLTPAERSDFLSKAIPRTFRNYYEDCGTCTLPTGKPGSNCCTVIDPAIPTIVCYCEDLC
jgi:hypothetical protein